MKFRYQDQSISIHYRNPLTHKARELVWDLTDRAYMARLVSRCSGKTGGSPIRSCSRTRRVNSPHP